MGGWGSGTGNGHRDYFKQYFTIKLESGIAIRSNVFIA